MYKIGRETSAGKLFIFTTRAVRMLKFTDIARAETGMRLHEVSQTELEIAETLFM